MAELTRYVRDELCRNDEVYRADELVAFLRDMAKHHEEADRPYHADALNDFADTLENK